MNVDDFTYFFHIIRQLLYKFFTSIMAILEKYFIYVSKLFNACREFIGDFVLALSFYFFSFIRIQLQVKKYSRC